MIIWVFSFIREDLDDDVLITAVKKPRKTESQAETLNCKYINTCTSVEDPRIFMHITQSFNSGSRNSTVHHQ